MIKKHLRYWANIALACMGLAIAGLFLILADVGLRLWGYTRVSRIFLALSPVPKASVVDEGHARLVGRYVNTAAAWRWLQSTCLRRSLVTWWLLRWLRIPSEIRFGVNVQEGHAWIEHHGVVVNDRPDIASRYRIHYGQELMPENLARRI